MEVRRSLFSLFFVFSLFVSLYERRSSEEGEEWEGDWVRRTEGGERNSLIVDDYCSEVSELVRKNMEDRESNRKKEGMGKG